MDRYKCSMSGGTDFGKLMGDNFPALYLPFGTEHSIFHENLEYCKVCAHWAPRCLMKEHKN
jgi:hypothetical protein